MTILKKIDYKIQISRALRSTTTILFGKPWHLLVPPKKYYAKTKIWVKSNVSTVVVEIYYTKVKVNFKLPLFLIIL